jgi:hypothetical protein
VGEHGHFALLLSSRIGNFSHLVQSFFFFSCRILIFLRHSQFYIIAYRQSSVGIRVHTGAAAVPASPCLDIRNKLGESFQLGITIVVRILITRLCSYQ